MKTYADYTFYSEEYNGKMLTEDICGASLLHASQYIRCITLGKSDSYEGDELKYAACAIAEAHAEAFDLVKGTSGNGKKKSENIDGYSVSYASQSKDGESSEELFKRKAYETAKLWLANTGLLNRRVKSVNKC